MSNQRRQFLGLAAGAIAVPATSSLVTAQGGPSRATPIPAQASVPERSAKSELTGLSALLTPEECVVLLIDHQPFQFANLHSHEPTMIVNNVIGLLCASCAAPAAGARRIKEIVQRKYGRELCLRQ